MDRNMYISYIMEYKVFSCSEKRKSNIYCRLPNILEILLRNLIDP
jgi:hypothetical protein